MIIKIDSNIQLVLNKPSHADLLFNAISNNRHHLSEFLPWVPHMLSLADVKSYLQHNVQLNKEELDYSFNIFQANEIVGRIGLSYINKANKTANIGYWLTQKAQGKGIISRATNTLISFAFEQLQLNRLEIKAAVSNLRSNAIPQKLGFTFEGILREAEWVNNQPLSLQLYALLRAEWMATKNALPH